MNHKTNIRGLLIYTIIFFFMGCVFAGCSSKKDDNKTSSSKNINKADWEDTAAPAMATQTLEKRFSLTEEKDVDYSQYEGWLLEAAHNVGKYNSYSMYDIDNDGIREMIMNVTDEGRTPMYYFYRLNKKGEAVECGTSSAMDSQLFANEKGTGVIQVIGQEGKEQVFLIRLQHGKLKRKLLREREVERGEYYFNGSPLSMCYVTDYSLLKKNAVLIGKELEKVDISEDAWTNRMSSLPISMNIIGMDFELYCKKANGVIREWDKTTLEKLVNIRPEQKLYYQNISRGVGEYYIVEDNTIVGFYYSNGTSSNTKMKNYFPTDDCYNIEPDFVSEDNNFTYCCWKTENSYLIYHGLSMGTDTSQYYNWSTSTYLILEDINIFNYSDQLREQLDGQVR